MRGRWQRQVFYRAVPILGTLLARTGNAGRGFEDEKQIPFGNDKRGRRSRKEKTESPGRDTVPVGRKKDSPEPGISQDERGRR
jgi:hypothetical protein